jgi:hypothetical protein
MFPGEIFGLNVFTRRLLMYRLLLVLSCVLSGTQAAAWECQPMSQIMGKAPIVFIGHPKEIVQRDAVVENDISSRTPRGYDLLRFSVIEQLKGDVPTTINLLCPADDKRCHASNNRNPLVIALSAPLIANVPQSLFCKMEYVTEPPGLQTDDTEIVRRLLVKFRAARQAKKRSG